MRLRAAVAALAAVAAAAPATSGAAAGPVRDCIADGAAPGCRALKTGSLAGASSLAVRGGRLYVAAYGAGQVLSFTRRPGGRLAPIACAACAGEPGYAVPGAAGVAAGPRGDVYAASGLGRSLTRYASAGALAFGSCLADFGRDGCADPAADVLAGASAVAVGPGGDDVYVAAFDGAAVVHVERAADGSLTLADCVADVGGVGCTMTPGAVLEGASALALSPDGRFLYATAFRSGGIVTFRRAPSGALRYAGCVADRGANKCRRVPTDSLVGASGLALSGDGRRLYVAAQTGTVAAFARGRRGGALRFRGCVGADGRGGCARPEHPTFAGASALAVHGRAVYVAARRSGAVTRLDADLGFVACATARRVRGCARGPAAALDGVYAVAAAGRDVYAASPTRASLSALRLTP